MTTLELYQEDIWNKTCDLIKESIDQNIYNTFFNGSKIVDISDEQCIITVPFIFNKNILNDKLELIEEKLEMVMDRKIPCKILLEGEMKYGKSPLETIHENQQSQSIFMKDKILPQYTFDNFVVGQSNRESHAAALACAYNPGKYYNPLFIYGNSGLGKTHLLNAIGNYLKQNSPGTKVYYTNSSDFVSSVVKSIKDGTIEQFKEEMNEVDVLLMDDIQFLAGKEKSHEIFFHIFNELVNNRKQIILTSDRQPNEIKGLEERLISRFSSGLSVGVDSPEFETALAILEKKMDDHKLEKGMLTEEVLPYIASNFATDVRSLEGALNRLLFYSINFASGNDGTIDLNMALSAFKGSSSGSEKKELTPKTIKRVVSDYYGLTSKQIESKSRTKNIANARAICMYLCRKCLDLPYVKIGEEFGKRDHSTVMNACERVEKNSRTDISYKQALGEIEKLLNH